MRIIDIKFYNLFIGVVLIFLPGITTAQAVSFIPVKQSITSGLLDKITSVADMNNDNLDDIVLITNVSNIQIHYQQSDGTYLVSNYPIPFIFVAIYSVTIGDIDNNGFNDIVLGHEDNRVDVCFANASGTDYSVTSYTDYTVFSQRGTMFDIDLDGDLDLFMCHDEGQNLVLKNEGNQSLVSDTSLVSISNPLQGLDLQGNYAAIWVDYDNDADADLYISKCKEGVTSSTDKRRVNLLYQNNGDGTFTDVAELTGLDDGEQSWITIFEDFDLDGDFDAFIINHTGGNKFMVNNGDGTFTDITSSTGIETTAVRAFEGDSFDFNNDGYMDIYSQLDKELYINNGDLTFSAYDLDFNQNEAAIKAEGGLADIYETGAVGDLNNDGFLDVFDSREGLHQINQGNSNNWFKLKLKGVSSNRQGVGSKVVLVSNLGTQTKEMRIGTSYSIQNTHTMSFGIGQDASITSLTIYWPSGVIDQIFNPTINSLLTVTEGDKTVGVNTSEIGNLNIFPNPVRDYLNIENKNKDIMKRISIRDLNGRLVFDTQNLISASHSLNLKALAEGMYFVEVLYKNQSSKRIKHFFKTN